MIAYIAHSAGVQACGVSRSCSGSCGRLRVRGGAGSPRSYCCLVAVGSVVLAGAAGIAGSVPLVAVQCSSPCASLASQQPVPDPAPIAGGSKLPDVLVGKLARAAAFAGRASERLGDVEPAVSDGA